MRAPVLVLGIGNILLRDEGVGVRVVEALRDRALPEGVELLDGGTAGADLIDALADRRKVVVIDAMDLGAEPGAVARLGGDGLAPDPGAPLSLHQVGLVEALWMARQLGCAPAEVVVLGVQPADLSPGLELTEAVARAVPRLAELVLDELG
jgi:hydrogenase maturation protease